MPITNRIITRGFGPSRGLPGRAGPITQGYGNPPQFVVSALQRNLSLRLGQSGTKRRLRELQHVIVWAKLIEVNDMPPKRKIEGFVKVPVNAEHGTSRVVVEHVASRVRSALSDIKVTIKRLRK